MGRRTYDVVSGFDVPWPYESPVLVASRRDLGDEVPDAVGGPDERYEMEVVDVVRFGGGMVQLRMVPKPPELTDPRGPPP